jgi:hypothetical protein
VVVDGELLDLLNDELLLALDDLADFGVVDCGVDLALHHGAAFVVFDIALPPLGWHSAIFGEALLSEVAEGQVISIGHEVLYLSALHLL